MPRPHSPDKLPFDIDTAIVFQLGEQLITDSVQALVELIKNAYDADASYAKIIVDTENAPGNDSSYPAARGFITVEDDGDGMTLETIRNGWLCISHSPKRQFKAQNQITEKGRTPLGDKGLGRLSAQRLADNIEIITRSKKDSQSHHVSFSWTDFRTHSRLSQVNATLEESSQRRSRGTTLILSALRDPSYWKGETALGHLQKELSKMFSPYQEVRDFFVTISVDGKPLELAEISQSVRNAALIRYRVDFDGERIAINGKARLSFLRVDTPKERPFFDHLLAPDNGLRFLDFLLDQPRAKDIKLRKAKSAAWFVEFQKERLFSSLDKLVLANSHAANPGPFHAELDFFELRQIEDSSGVFDTTAEFKQYIKDFAGVRVYRDGFGVRVPSDLLDLGKGWTQARSYYGLKPANTLGFIAISARHNSQLLETTNREAFSDTAYYHNFRLILQEVVRFSDEAQETIRRAWNEYKRQAAIPPDEEPVPSERLAEDLRNAAQQVAFSQQAVAHTKNAVGDAVASASDVLKSLAEELPKNSPRYRDVEKANKKIVNANKEAKQLLEQAEESLRKIDQVRSLSDQLGSRFEVLREQLAEVYDLVSLGLTAEVLSHEIEQIIDGLAGRTKQIRAHLAKKGTPDMVVATYLEHVGSSIAGLRKQLGHLAPSLRFARHRREPISVPDYLEELIGYHRERLQTHAIEMSLGRNGSPFVVVMNKGKLTQVVDNLVLNSEYWLTEDIRTGRLQTGRIVLDAESPHLRIRDNGEGIDASVENSLFQPFVTAKAKGKGRGLGLFICRQLLDSEGCSISVLPRRNRSGRLYIFDIDLSGAIREDQQ